MLVGGHQLALAATAPHPGDVEQVAARFSRCAEGRAVHCVVDGDTIRIGDRRIRLVGFDAPEKNARCEAERLGAARATAALQDWLNRGPFTMRVEAGTDRTDRYGRDLRAALREEGALSGYMVGGNLARSYGGGSRGGWC
jgi:endonuclease YncB( thermonuclease family)